MIFIKFFRRCFSLLLATLFMFNLAPFSFALHGDINCDEYIGIEDAILALKFATGIETPDEQHEHAADLNYDGKITTEDVRLIMRCAAAIDEVPDHKFSDWKTVIKPTCLQEGLAECNCIYCGKRVTKILDKAEHNIIPATCQTASYCSVCNESFGEPAEHIENEGYCVNCNELLNAPSLSYNFKEIKFGSSAASVKNILGEPQNKYKDITADKTYVVYVYYTDYKDLAIFTFTDGELTQFFSNATTAQVSQGSTHYGLYCKSVPQRIGDISLTVYSDTLNNDFYYCFVATVGEGYGLTKTTDFTLNEKINFHLTNGLRALNGVDALDYCAVASKVAKAHSEDMAKRNYFDHTNPDGLSPADRLTNGGIDWWACGENIAAGYPDPYFMANGWYNSSGHRKNILNPGYTHLGIGFAYKQNSEYRYYGTQDYYKQ